MVNRLHLQRSSLTSGPSKRLTILLHIHTFIHTFTHRRRCQPCRATASSSGAVRVRCHAQGYIDTQLGRAGEQTSNLPVTSQPALPPEPHGTRMPTPQFNLGGGKLEPGCLIMKLSVRQGHPNKAQNRGLVQRHAFSLVCLNWDFGSGSIVAILCQPLNHCLLL